MNERLVKASPGYWLSGVVAVVVATTITVEARYAKAGDVVNAKEELKREMALQRSYTETGFLRNRKAVLEDKVFELDAKRQMSRLNEVELKQLLRYQAELDDVNRDLRSRRMGGRNE